VRAEGIKLQAGCDAERICEVQKRVYLVPEGPSWTVAGARHGMTAQFPEFFVKTSYRGQSVAILCLLLFVLAARIGFHGSSTNLHKPA
jgi:hypothetical protein